MPTIKFIAPSHVLSEHLDDEMVLLNIDTERYYCLDDVGTWLLFMVRSEEQTKRRCYALSR